jgi:hypothetical protein
MKSYGRVGVQLPTFLVSELDRCEWSASRPCRFTHGKIASWYPLVRKLGGPLNRAERCGENCDKPHTLKTGFYIRREMLTSTKNKSMAASPEELLAAILLRVLRG